MTVLTRHFVIKAKDFVRAGEVSLSVQRLLKEIGLSPHYVRRASICAYESEMNVVMHGGDGELLLTVDPENIFLEVKDDGPGIEDIDLALQEGYSTASPEHRAMGFGAGMGLPNIKKNSDAFEIRSRRGEGVYLRIGFSINAAKQ